MDLGFQLALQVLGVYGLLGPFIFFLVYIFFDRLAERTTPVVHSKSDEPRAPSMWSYSDVDAYLEKKDFFEVVTQTPG